MEALVHLNPLAQLENAFVEAAGAWPAGVRGGHRICRVASCGNNVEVPVAWRDQAFFWRLRPLRVGAAGFLSACSVTVTGSSSPSPLTTTLTTRPP